MAKTLRVSPPKIRRAATATRVVTLVLMEHKTMPFDAEQLRSLGIEPSEQKIIVVKSAIAWQAASTS